MHTASTRPALYIGTVARDTLKRCGSRLLRGVRLASGMFGADEIGRRRLNERGREALLPVVETARHFALDVLHELVHFVLHQLDLASHVEDDLDAGEVDAEISRNSQNRLELIKVLV